MKVKEQRIRRSNKSQLWTELVMGNAKSLLLGDTSGTAGRKSAFYSSWDIGHGTQHF